MEQLLVSGFGGQGVLSLGLLIAEAGVREGLEATFFPSYGAEMRGGTANCQIILSEKRIGSPIINSIDSLIAMNGPSISKFRPQLKKDGLLIVNSSVIKGIESDEEHAIIEVPADDMALEQIGNSRAANIIMIGVYLKKKAIVSIEKIKKAISDKFKSKGEKIINDNLMALDLGYSFL